MRKMDANIRELSGNRVVNPERFVFQYYANVFYRLFRPSHHLSSSPYSSQRVPNAHKHNSTPAKDHHHHEKKKESMTSSSSALSTILSDSDTTPEKTSHKPSSN